MNPINWSKQLNKQKHLEQNKQGKAPSDSRMNSELKGTETIGVTDEVRFNMRVDNRGPEGLMAVRSDDANAVVGEGLHN